MKSYTIFVLPIEREPSSSGGYVDTMPFDAQYSAARCDAMEKMAELFLRLHNIWFTLQAVINQFPTHYVCCLLMKLFDCTYTAESAHITHNIVCAQEQICCFQHMYSALLDARVPQTTKVITAYIYIVNPESNFKSSPGQLVVYAGVSFPLHDFCSCGTCVFTCPNLFCKHTKSVMHTG